MRSLRSLLPVAALLAATGCYPYWTGQRLEERIVEQETPRQQ